jgi:methylenetetrahydrofolate reductase (NADPH)
VHEVADLSVGVAAFPEGHPRSPDLASDRRHLAAKLGGRLRHHAVLLRRHRLLPHGRRARALGVDTPVIPGVVAFVNVDALLRMSSLNGAHVPTALAERLEQVAGDPPRCASWPSRWPPS